MARKIEFSVSIGIGGAFGDTTVKVSVTNKEYKLLKECCEEEEEITEYDGLEKLCEKIASAIREESDFDGDFEELDFGIEMPEEIYEALEEE